MALPQRTAMGMSLLAAIAVSASAQAQTLSLGDNQDAVVRDATHQATQLANNEINKADCVRDEIIEFNVGVVGVIDDEFELEVWKGTDCANARTRFEDTSNCVQIPADAPRNEVTLNVDIPVRALVSIKKGSTSSSSGGTGGTSGTGGTESAGSGGTSAAGGVGGGGAGGSGATGGGGTGGSDATSGTGGGGTSGSAGEGGNPTYSVGVCDADRTYETPQDLPLHFLLANGNGDQPAGTYTAASWSAKYDLVGPDAPNSVSAGVGENTLILSWAIEDNRGDIDRYRAYCDPPPGTPSEDPDDCGSNLQPGVEPDDTYFCGESDGYSASMQTERLENGVKYSVAVAGVDNFENIGLLSDYDCKAPQLVTDFYEAYRRAGGKGGGGFCGIGAGNSQGFAVILALGALGLMARRRAARARRETR